MKTAVSQRAIYSREHDITPDFWTICARRAFANLLRFGPSVLSQSSVNMLKKKSLVTVDRGGLVMPEEWALTLWNQWVAERRMRALAAVNRKREHKQHHTFFLV